MTAYLAGPTGTLAEFEALIRCAAENGYDAVYTTDHFVQPMADNPPCLDPWLTLARATALGSFAEVGVMAVPMPLYSAAHIMRSKATIELLFPSRVTIGVGAGWHDADFESTGRARKAFPKRVAELRRGLIELMVRARSQTAGPGTVRPVPGVPGDFVVAGASAAVAAVAAELEMSRNRWNYGLAAAPSDGIWSRFHSTQAILLPDDLELPSANISPFELNQHGALRGRGSTISAWRTRLESSGLTTLLVPDFHIRGIESRRMFLAHVARHLLRRTA